MVEIIFNEDKMYNGVFYYMQRQFRVTDICAAGKINVESTKACNESDARNVQWPLITKSITNTYWKTTNDPGNFYLIDFKKSLFVLKSYVYRTYYLDFFTEWIIYGSYDKEEYEEVDHKTDFTLPDAGSHTFHFNVTNKPKPFRYFKFVPVGKNFRSVDFLAIHRMEFFGTFFDAHKNERTCLRRRQSFTFTWKVLLIIMINS